ncbi:MAG: dihydrodipicolinate synthase family protein [Candidatus Atribacteria bacterium]|nr:dihydrodipicolinate synthase family protein [Candidatus Atribacteria bacterium]
MNADNIHGVIVPVITPINDREEIDQIALQGIIERLIKAKVDGVFMGGSAGEGPLLPIHQWTQLMQKSFEFTQNRVILMGGVIDTSSAKIKKKIRILKDIGYSYVVITPSFYISIHSESEQFRLFAECYEECDGMEMIAYNIPSCTGSKLSIKVLCDLARRGWIHWCKESSGVADYYTELIQKGKDAGLSVLMGDEVSILPALFAGAKGIVPGCANVDPATFVSIYRSALQKNFDDLRKYNDRIIALRKNLPLAGTCWISGIKYALSVLGFGNGKVLSPLEPLNDQQKAQVESFLSSSSLS